MARGYIREVVAPSFGEVGASGASSTLARKAPGFKFSNLMKSKRAFNLNPVFFLVLCLLFKLKARLLFIRFENLNWYRSKLARALYSSDG